MELDVPLEAGQEEQIGEGVARGAKAMGVATVTLSDEEVLWLEAIITDRFRKRHQGSFWRCFGRSSGPKAKKP